MIGLDTNVLVRYIVQDDAHQAAAATGLIEGQCTRDNPGLVSHLVLAELCWVLGRGYGYDRKLQASVLSALLATAELRVQQPDSVWPAIRAFEQGPADFADYLMAQINREQGCDATWTFDRKAAQSPLHRLLAGDGPQ